MHTSIGLTCIDNTRSSRYLAAAARVHALTPSRRASVSQPPKRAEAMLLSGEKSMSTSVDVAPLFTVSIRQPMGQHDGAC